MTSRADELETFKTDINLTEYAAAEGYTLDRKASSRNSALMAGEGDKIVVARGADRHWVYFSVYRDDDSGSIIDFVQNRKNVSLGEVRKILRPWVGASPSPALSRPSPQTFLPDLEPVTRDLARVRARFHGMAPAASDNAYLRGRGLPARILGSARFADRIRVDARRNVIFPHWNRDGICGWEAKNDRFTGFAPGGTKGLWPSRIFDRDRDLVIAETAIDALSYAALHGVDVARFLSIGGAMNPEQPALLCAAMQKMSPGSRVVLALDNDEGGDRLAAEIIGIFEELGRDGLMLVEHRPSRRGQDWNDVLRGNDSSPLPDPGP